MRRFTWGPSWSCSGPECKGFGFYPARPGWLLGLVLANLLLGLSLDAQDAERASAPAAIVSGTVTDSLSGRPLAGALIELLRPGQSLAEVTTTTDLAGNFFLSNLEKGNFIARASQDGYQAEVHDQVPDCTPEGCLNLATRLDVEAGAFLGDIDFTLTPEGMGDPGPEIDSEHCRIDVAPAATLLFPYFEVESGNPQGRTTLISINNSHAAPRLVRVTLWTDFGEPSLGFDLYLTGYDVQTLNLRDIFVQGTLPHTGPSMSPQGSLSQLNEGFPGCSAAMVEPGLDGARRAHLQAWHSGQQSPTSGTCAGSRQEGLWIGYVTVDVVRECADLDPTSVGYFGPPDRGVAGDANVLFGDLFYVTTEEDFAQGEPAVHLRADRASFPFGSYTFYGAHAMASWDARQPLGSEYAIRYLNGGAFDGGAELIVWRDTKSQGGGEVVCGSLPSWAPLPTSPILAFDEEENPQVLPEEPSPFPFRTQRVPVGEELLPTMADFGWLWMSLDHQATPRFGTRAQGLVWGTMSALGRFSIGFRATQVGGVCGAADR